MTASRSISTLFATESSEAFVALAFRVRKANYRQNLRVFELQFHDALEMCKIKQQDQRYLATVFFVPQMKENTRIFLVLVQEIIILPSGKITYNQSIAHNCIHSSQVLVLILNDFWCLDGGQTKFWGVWNAGSLPYSTSIWFSVTTCLGVCRVQFVRIL